MSAKPKKKNGAGGHGGHGGGASSERWLLTYSDMITLLMVFFIVMYASSEVNKAKYEAVAAGLRKAFGGGNMVVPMNGVGDGVSVPMPVEIVKPASGSTGDGKSDGKSAEEILKEIGQTLYADFSHDGRFTVWLNERGMTISLAGNAFFDPGKADIKPEIKPLLDAIAERLKGIPNDISVEGFTDSDPIHTAEFPSNWELSLARANRVRAYLESKGVAGKRMLLTASGDTRPVFDNSTADGKSKNRRVDLVILLSKYEVKLGQEIKTDKK